MPLFFWIRKEVYLFVGTTAASNPVDFTDTSDNTTGNVVVISYSDADHLLPTVNWTMQKVFMFYEN